jgi:hypothetical protein
MMKNNRTAFLPAFLVAVASLLLILYSYFGMAHTRPPEMNAGSPHVGMGPRTEKSGEDLFRTLGTISIYLAAASYAWFRLKKKRKTPSPLVRFLVKWFDKLHKYTGYATIALIAAHGVYFLTKAAIKEETYTGIAAFALLLSLGIYGYLIRRLSNKHMRKVHFSLATAFVVAALIHVGGSVIIATLIVVVFWGLVRLIERMAKPSEANAGA